MKRVVMTLEQIRDEQRAYYEALGDNVDTMGIMALVDIENMGWCKDGATRYYMFTNEDGQEAIYFKH